MTVENKRKSYYDFIRIFAIFFVIFNHTPGYHLPYKCEGDAFPLLLFAPIVKMAVPLFFMVSGALLLPKKEAISDIYKKRVLRFICVIILFQFLQHAFYIACFNDGKHEIGLSNFIYSICTGETFVTVRTSACAVWFFYAYLAYLMMLPFLRCMVSNMEKVHFYYWGFLQIVLIGIIPYVFVFIYGNISDNFEISGYLYLCNNVIMWTIAGYFIENRVDINILKRRHFITLILVSIMFIGLAGIAPEIIRERVNAELPQQNAPFIMQFLLIPCCTFVLIMKKIFLMCKLSTHAMQVLRCAGEAVFSVVIIENILRLGIYKLLFPTYHSSFWPSVWVSCLVLLVGLFLGVILKKIPFIRKLI